MAKTATIYVCAECGNEFAQWVGKCTVCDTWNSLKEFKGTGNSQIGRTSQWVESTDLLDLGEIEPRANKRLSSMPEVDRVLGGGIVAGSAILLSGEPGVGKSTLLLQLAAAVGGEVKYLSGEESAEQISARARRLKITSRIKLGSISNVNHLVEAIQSKPIPSLVVIDSIQTAYDPNFPSTPGSLVQVRESALRLVKTAKSVGVPIVLTGHVTKEGTLAGPRVLEHLVDVVLAMEGDRYRSFRMIRGVKNRYGPTDEVGVFEMTEKGLAVIENPSAQFLGERKSAPGSVITCLIEGARPFLVEVQALVSKTKFGYAKRRSIGIEANRLELVLAVLEKKLNLKLSNYDIFANVVGGLSIREPAADLAIALAVTSSLKGKKVLDKVVVFGEVGLTGEVRAVRLAKRRQKEASRFGFETVQRSSLAEAVSSLLV